MPHRININKTAAAAQIGSCSSDSSDRNNENEVVQQPNNILVKSDEEGKKSTPAAAVDWEKIREKKLLTDKPAAAIQNKSCIDSPDSEKQNQIVDQLNVLYGSCRESKHSGKDMPNVVSLASSPSKAPSHKKSFSRPHIA